MQEFAGPSRRFFERVRAGDFVVLISAKLAEELAGAPLRVRAVLADLRSEDTEAVDTSDEVRALARAYLAEGILGASSEDDAVHVAVATVSGADLMVSWNFRHLVRYDNIRRFNDVNARKGYPTIDIRSPLELGYGNADQEEEL